MISTIQNHFPILFLSIVSHKTVIYDKEGNEVKVVNEVALNEIMPKALWPPTGKRNMDWRNDQAATLYYVEAIDAGNPENKVDFRDKYGNGRLSTKMLRFC
jgi:hypothetical protein